MGAGTSPIVGIRSCTTGQAFGAADLDALHSAGFSCVELSFNRPASVLDWRDAALGAQIAARARQLSMVLTAHAPEHLWLTDPDAARRARAAEELADILETMAVFEPQCVVIHACAGNRELSGRGGEQADALADALGRCEPACRRRGMRLLVETMCPGVFTSRFDAVLDAVDAVNSPHVGVCIDTNHLNLTEDLPAAIARAGSRTGEFHVNDNHGAGEEHLLPFDGVIDWPAFTRAVAATGFRGPLVMEPSHFDSRRHPSLLAAAADAARRLAQLISASAPPSP